MGNEIKGHGAYSDRSKPKVYIDLLDTLETLDVKSSAMVLLLPRHERFALAAEIRNSMNQIRRYAVSSWVLFHKGTALRNLDLEKEVLKGWVRKCLFLRYISAGQSKEWMEIILEFGRQIGGWIEHEKKKAEAKKVGAKG